MTPSQLVQRRQDVQQKIRELEDELTAIEGALAMHGARRPGRPRTRRQYTAEEALRGWNLKRAGDTSPEVLAAAAQYARDAKRRHRRHQVPREA